VLLDRLRVPGEKGLGCGDGIWNSGKCFFSISCPKVSLEEDRDTDKVQNFDKLVAAAFAK